MVMQDLPFEVPASLRGRVRDVASVVLRSARRTLAGLAAALAPQERRPAVSPVLEFHAEAGAPEGALYVDGRLVGHVLGVSRL